MGSMEKAHSAHMYLRLLLMTELIGNSRAGSLSNDDPSYTDNTLSFSKGFKTFS